MRWWVLLMVGLAAAGTARGDERDGVVAEFEAGRGGRHILIPWEREGRTMYFVLDTGAARSCVDPGVFPGLRPVGLLTVTTVSGKQEMAMSAPPAVSVGPFRLGGVTSVASVEMAPHARLAGRPLAGILGADVMREFVVQVDFDAGRVRVMRAGAGGDRAAWGTRVPMAWNNGTPTIRAEAGGQTADFRVDTGSGEEVALPGWWFDKVVATAAGAPATRRALGAGGWHSSRSARLAALDAGGRTYRDVALSDMYGDRPRVGLRFLARHVVTLDFPGEAMFLKPGKRIDERGGRCWSGLWLERVGEETRVVEVAADGPNASGDVRVGDVVEAVGGTAARDLELFDVQALLGAGEERVVEVVLVRGGERRVVGVKVVGRRK